ncbi:methyltransferase [Clostridium aceticum]|uniref:Methyltransferase n=1 Tax=Clostridium aceticum TaxID=84022 RepID=A0A0G3W6H1_9CLOT|nr:class I SAM-dependent methyltransferase [Clostridium aceticum]AKL94301.1 methyltransferase [Clostridium aceticum]
MKELKDWIEAWQPSEQNTSACTSFWNNRAKSYNEGVPIGESNHVMDLLRSKGILQKTSTVLDIGCGPGRYTIPMAKECREVVAIDISQEMLQYAKDHAISAGLDNIIYKQSTWEDIDLKEYGWEKKFDVVLASMTPGVYNFATFKKMLEASKGYCYLSGFIQRSNQLWDPIQKEVLGEDSRKQQDDKIYYAFNILWQLGYHPEIFYQERTWEQEWSLEEIQELYKQRFEINHAVQQKDIEKIEKLLAAHQKDGKVIEKTEAKTAALIWKL